MDESQERDHMAKAIDIITQLTGERPLGWYTGRTGPNTRRLVAEEGGFLYDSDAYDDDLPYWHTQAGATTRYSLYVRCQRYAFCYGTRFQFW